MNVPLCKSTTKANGVYPILHSRLQHKSLSIANSVHPEVQFSPIPIAKTEAYNTTYYKQYKSQTVYIPKCSVDHYL